MPSFRSIAVTVIEDKEGAYRWGLVELEDEPEPEPEPEEDKKKRGAALQLRLAGRRPRLPGADGGMVVDSAR